MRMPEQLETKRRGGVAAVSGAVGLAAGGPAGRGRGISWICVRRLETDRDGHELRATRAQGLRVKHNACVT